MQRQAQLAAFLEQYTVDWPRQGVPAFLARTYSPSSAFTVEQLADDLFRNLEDRALKLGTFLNTPDGKFLAAAVSALSPPPLQQDVALLMKALQLAAQMQQKAARDNLVAAIVVGVGIGVVATAIRNA